MARINNQIAAIKKELVEQTHYLKIWGTFADLYVARNNLATELGIEVKTPSDNDPIDASMAEYLAGYQAYQDGDFTGAEDYFSESINLLGWNIIALLNLGNLYFIQGAHEKAAIIFDQALEHSENGARSEVLTNLGMNAIKRDMIPDAEEFFRQAIDLDPDNALALNDMGIVKEMEGIGDEAVGYYKQAVQADPSDNELWYNLGTMLGKQGNKEGRLYCFIKAEERGSTELREMINDLVDQGIKPVNPFRGIES